MPTSLNILFAGTPDFSVPCTASLHRWCLDHGHQVVGVLTQPDRPAGRGKKIRQSPVKQWAAEHAIAVAQPKSLKTQEGFAEFAKFDADLVVVVAYGLLLPSTVLQHPRFGCINVHASLLPRWRGAAPIQRAIAAGDVRSGVCVMQMDEGLDTGPVWSQTSIELESTETGGSLHDKLSTAGAQLLIQTLPDIISGQYEPQPQSDQGVTYAHKLSKSEARIDWKQSARTIERLIRAYNPWPVAHTRLGERGVRIFAARVLSDDCQRFDPGEVVQIGGKTDDRLCVATANGILEVLRLQPAGSRIIGARDFLNASQSVLRRSSSRPATWRFE